MTTSTPGPGITWLPHQSGTSEDELLADPAAPCPGECFGTRAAEILQDAAQRVRDAD